MSDIEIVISEFKKEFANKVVKKLKEKSPEDTGESKNNIEKIEKKDKIVIRIPKNLVNINQGTKPFNPPYEPLLNWTKRKLNMNKTTGYKIIEKIKTEGIHENSFIEESIEEVIKN
ncbi:MAG: hypothetical protein ACOCRX_11550, partial [Candidatus Woesearchaeota archaeon]